MAKGSGAGSVGAVTSGTEEATSQILKSYTRGESYSATEFGEQSILGYGFGHAGKYLSGLVKGRNNPFAKADSLYTKAINGSISNVSNKSATNMSGTQFISGTPQTLYNGVDRRLTNKQINKATNHIEKANDAIKAGNYSEAMRQLQKVNQTISAPKSKPRSR